MLYIYANHQYLTCALTRFVVYIFVTVFDISNSSLDVAVDVSNSKMIKASYNGEYLMTRSVAYSESYETRIYITLHDTELLRWILILQIYSKNIKCLSYNV